jgi:hypothetical protein
MAQIDIGWRGVLVEESNGNGHRWSQQSTTAAGYPARARKAA